MGKPVYEIRQEWADDLTLSEPVATYTSKREAIRVARHIAKTATLAAAIVVGTDGMTVAVIECRRPTLLAA